MIRRLTEAEIAIRVVPTMLRWPGSEAAKTLAWDRLRDCGEALRALLRALDDACHRAEQNADLKPEAIARRRKELGDEALSKLAAFKPLLSAERAVHESIDDLDRKTQSLLTKGLDELREGVAATKRAVVERCQMLAEPQLNDIAAGGVLSLLTATGAGM